MRPARPLPGSSLSDENGRTFAIVIIRGWTMPRIFEAATAVHGMTREEMGDYELQTWRYCTAQWRRNNGISWEYDAWWAADGDGATSIDVAAWDNEVAA